MPVGEPRTLRNREKRKKLSIVPVSAALAFPDPSSMTKEFFEAMKSERGSSLADVFLITSDGEHIPAVRALLRFSSPYFEKLFSSDFAEKNLAEVPVSISSAMLQEVLEFVYTDDCRIIRRVRQHFEEEINIDCQEMVAVFELADVADYAALERLVTRCTDTMRNMILSSSHHACLVWQYLRKGRDTWGAEIIKEAIEATVSDIEESFLQKEKNCSLKCGLLHLDEQAVEDAFASCMDAVEGEEMIFQALIVWATGGTALRSKWRRAPWTDVDLYVNTENITILEERREVANRIASWFDMYNVKPRFLANVIEPTGLVERRFLHDVYRLKAVELEERVANSDSKFFSNERTIKRLRREVKELRENF